MARPYWIKLYIEVIDDPKMGLLPDDVWRAAVELFCIAGEYNREGLLPPLPDIKWRLRWDDEKASNLITKLENIGIITSTEAGLLVTNFARRQAPATGAERAQRYRDKQHNKQYYGNRNGGVTSRYVDTDTDTDTELKDSSKTEAASGKTPKPKIDKTNLLINATPGGAILKREMDKVRASKGLAQIKYYANVRQAEAFEAVYDELGDELQPLIRKGLQRERESRSALLAFLEVCARNKRNAGQPKRKTSKPQTSAEDILAQLEKEG